MMERIDSAANKKIKLAAGLRLKKHRDREGLFVAEGIRLVEMAAASAWQPVYALCTAAAAQQCRVQAVLQRLSVRGCPVYEVPEPVYKKASNTVEPQGLLLVMRQKQFSLETLLAGRNGNKKTPFLVVMDGVQDPGNAGTIIRTADAVGCSGVVCLENTVDIFSDKTVRSAMGSLFHLPIVVQVQENVFRDFLQGHGIRLLAAALDDTAQQHFQIDYTLPSAVVFGNEGNGISPGLLAAADGRLFIPMAGGAESLNVAVAAAVVLYEALRQRHYA